MSRLLGSLLIVAFLACCTPSIIVCASAETLQLLVAYPPNEFGSAGAVVNVDSTSGAWTLVGTFKWPSAIFGRPDLYDPIYYFSPESGKMYLDIGDDFGYVIVVDMNAARVVDHFQHSDPFFVGFTNMKLDENGDLIGCSPVGNDDGIFSFGKLDMASHKYTNMSLIMFRSMMDDSDYYDATSHTYYVQADYDMRPNPMCPGGKELCLLAIDTDTGAIRSTVKTNFTVYKFNQATPPTSVQSWIQGDVNDFCPVNSGADFMFGDLDVQTGVATPESCISSQIIIQEEPWESAFSPSGKLLATGSRFAQSTQILVFDVATGATVLNTNLPGLDKRLHPAEGMYYIWGFGWKQ